VVPKRIETEITGSSEKEPQLKKIENIEPIFDISDWKVYRNERFGFTLKFPESWKEYEVKVHENDSYSYDILPAYEFFLPVPEEERVQTYRITLFS